MVSHELQGHLKLLYIHVLLGCCCCTTMEASVTEMSSVPGLNHGSWQHEQGQIVCLGALWLLSWPGVGPLGGPTGCSYLDRVEEP